MNHSNLERIRLPRLSASADSSMGSVIRYLKNIPIDVRFILSELLHNAYFVRSISLGQNSPRTRDRGKDSISEEFIREEAFKSIWFFWGHIESICSASNIPTSEVINRLKCADSQEASEWSGLKIRDIANWAEKERAEKGENRDLQVLEEESERIDDISAAFGA
jgi:hypothetical protein